MTRRTVARLFFTVFFAVVLASPSGAAMLRIDYAATLENYNFGPVFGASGPVDFTATIVVDTLAAPVLIVPAGTTAAPDFGETWNHDIYGYAAAALTVQGMTFGTKTFTMDDLLPRTTAIGFPGAALWTDHPLEAGATIRQTLVFEDNDGDMGLGSWMCELDAGCAMTPNFIGIIDRTNGFTSTFGDLSVTVSSIPAPAAIWLLAPALAMLAALRR